MADKGLHGHSDQRAATRPHTQQAVMRCVPTKLLVRIDDFTGVNGCQAVWGSYTHTYGDT